MPLPPLDAAATPFLSMRRYATDDAERDAERATRFATRYCYATLLTRLLLQRRATLRWENVQWPATWPFSLSMILMPLPRRLRRAIRAL